MSQNSDNIIDLQKVSEAFNSLEFENRTELESFWEETQKFKEAVCPSLNKAEFKTFLVGLFQDQVVSDVSDDQIVEIEDPEAEDVELNQDELATVAGGFGRFSARKFRFKEPMKVLPVGKGKSRIGFTLRAKI
tara:strand:- start:6840 stop:7238 length:399 start_codon:yes stop_codon:yes gene_type:complete